MWELIFRFCAQFFLISGLIKIKGWVFTKESFKFLLNILILFVYNNNFYSLERHLRIKFLQSNLAINSLQFHQRLIPSSGAISLYNHYKYVYREYHSITLLQNVCPFINDSSPKLFCDEDNLLHNYYIYLFIYVCFFGCSKSILLYML